MKKASVVDTRFSQLFHSHSGAGNEIRTRDLNLGKVALYQLSYSRMMFDPRRKPLGLLALIIDRSCEYTSVFSTRANGIDSFAARCVSARRALPRDVLANSVRWRKASRVHKHCPPANSGISLNQYAMPIA